VIGKSKNVLPQRARGRTDRKEKSPLKSALIRPDRIIAVSEKKIHFTADGADERGSERIGTSPESKKQKPIFPLRPLRLKPLLFQFSLFGNFGDFGNLVLCVPLCPLW
jgi:hypothetical protein